MSPDTRVQIVCTQKGMDHQKDTKMYCSQFLQPQIQPCAVMKMFIQHEGKYLHSFIICRFNMIIEVTTRKHHIVLGLFMPRCFLLLMFIADSILSAVLFHGTCEIIVSSFILPSSHVRIVFSVNLIYINTLDS